MQKRSGKNYSIDDILYSRFEKIIKRDKINKSRLIESFIEKYVDENENFSIDKPIIFAPNIPLDPRLL